MLKGLANHLTEEYLKQGPCLKIARDTIMPTVFEDGPYSFIFFSSDGGEPPHIHVKRERCMAKFWLNPVALVKNRGFPGHELNRIARFVGQHESTLLEAWDEYFSS